MCEGAVLCVGVSEVRHVRGGRTVLRRALGEASPGLPVGECVGGSISFCLCERWVR